jgi:hypothetical protein
MRVDLERGGCEDMDQQIQSAPDQLNERLVDRFPYKLHIARASEIDFVAVNALGSCSGR